MTVAGELINILGFKLEGEQNLKKFNKGMDKAEDKAKASSAKLAMLGKAAGVAGVAMVGLGVKAVTQFAAFERQMNRIGVTAGASVKATSDASDELQRLAMRFALPLDSAIEGLDVLTSSGQSLEEAMAFLPSVLATAQASGAATSDIANTALKASSALKIEAKDLQGAFDIMVAGGKAGQFELKDMAQYIPELANSFASLGYKGEGGLQKLIALMQTVREDTGSASSAATGLSNIFGKINAGETANAFKKNFGVDLPASLKKAQLAGEDTVAAFVRISKEAIKGDLSKLPLLFTDAEFRNGMQSLITSADAYKGFLETVNGTNVDGTVFRDLQTFTNDTTASIQRMSNAWDKAFLSIGGAIAPTATAGLNEITDEIAKETAIRAELSKQGYGFLGATFYQGSEEDKNRLARQGGYIPNNDPAAVDAAKYTPKSYVELGRSPMRPGQSTSGLPPAAPVTDAGGREALSGILSRIDNMNANLTRMVPENAVEATVTDARQDNRQFPVSTSVTVNQTVTQPAAAPGAAAQATGSAVAAAVNGAARIEQGPAF